MLYAYDQLKWDIKGVLVLGRVYKNYFKRILNQEFQYNDTSDK